MTDFLFLFYTIRTPIENESILFSSDRTSINDTYLFIMYGMVKLAEQSMKYDFQ
ncbi:hypothetical protein N781_01310 [Pontibacillus halophilus JSM 076056 = DSM 19796]|uniref:Uncharacterized protein n=1 Tax=Pontibacillus halophilus JSM 076056 = DSM 19796 TaxID=1385510 RepID=A0A0A5GS66_9BACI|nr:hypothetical protein N781_01310 [Pontibacillus halophilus JSM 076056 = DSM 19796]